MSGVALMNMHNSAVCVYESSAVQHAAALAVRPWQPQNLQGRKRSRAEFTRVRDHFHSSSPAENILYFLHFFSIL